MQRLLKIQTVLGLMAVSGAACSSPPDSPDPTGLRLTVLVQDYSGLPDAVLEDFGAETGSLLFRSGLDVGWVPGRGEQMNRAPVAWADATVLVYDQTGLPEAVLAKAMATAARAFERSGVSMVWTLCSRESTTCREEIMPTHLLLHFVPRGPRHKLALTHYLGFCTERAAHVIVTRVFELAHQHEVQPEPLLGYVAAHEIGHLLLGPSHSKTGIMRQNWDVRDLLNTTRGWLEFRPHDAEGIRQELQKRGDRRESDDVRVAATR